MKSKKWLTYTLGILLTLVVLAAVGGIGYRIGAMQSASSLRLTDGQSARAPFFAHGQRMDNDFNPMQRGFEFDRGRGDRHRGGFLSPIFGLLHLIVLGALAWFGYKLIKNSGWKLVKVNAPVVEQPSEAAASDEKKE